MTEFQYEIGGKKYFQGPLVMGQWQQLLAFIKDKKLPAKLSPRQVIESFGDDIHEGIAIILSEDGKHLKDKDIKALAEEIKFSILPEKEFEIIKDFFDCNPIASMLEKLTGKLMEIVETWENGLKKSSPSSAKETSPSETKSSGDLPRENAGLSLDTE